MADTGLMESVIDYIKADLEAFADATDADGGIADIVGTDVVVFWGDPGIIAVQNYPCFTVEPVQGQPAGGTTQTENRDLTVLITFLMDAREYWDVGSPEEATGDRTLVRVADRLEARYASKAKSLLDRMQGVRSVSVSGTQYTPQPRGAVFAKSAEMTLTVNKSRPRSA